MLAHAVSLGREPSCGAASPGRRRQTRRNEDAAVTWRKETRAGPGHDRPRISGLAFALGGLTWLQGVAV